MKNNILIYKGDENMEFIKEDIDVEMTFNELEKSEKIIEAIGLTGRIEGNRFAERLVNGDIILKIESEEFGNVLSLLIKENSNFTNFKITYIGKERFVEVGRDGVNCLICDIADEVEIISIKGLDFLDI